MHLIANQAYKLSFVSWGRSPHPTLGVDNPKSIISPLSSVGSSVRSERYESKGLGFKSQSAESSKDENNNQELPIIIYQLKRLENHRCGDNAQVKESMISESVVRVATFAKSKLEHRYVLVKSEEGYYKAVQFNGRTRDFDSRRYGFESHYRCARVSRANVAVS